jgi:hypothetical protein
MNKTPNGKTDSPKQEKKYDLIIIGDIVYDRITITEENQEPLEKEYPGGAIFVKNFLESDHSIESDANIYGYSVDEIKKTEPTDLYSIEIPKKINTIPLEKQKTGNYGNEAYRIKGPTTKTKDEDKKIWLSFPEPSQSTERKKLQILVVTDLGISSSPAQNLNGKSDSNQDSVWIGKREIQQQAKNSTEANYEWSHRLRIAYDNNKSLIPVPDQGKINSVMPWHFITINHPRESLFKETVYSCFKNGRDNGQIKSKFKQEEAKEIKKRTLAIVYGDHLRSGCNLAIARRISIERTAQDFLQELHTNPLLNELGSFEHLIVRFGLLAVVHSYRIKNRRFHRLFFDPKNIYKPKYSTKLSGGVTGTQTLLLDNIIRQLLKLDEEEQKNPYDVAEKIGDGIKLGIVDCRKRYDNGYGKNTSEALEFLGPESIRKTFQDNQNSEKEYSVADIADERIPLAHPTWSILAQSAEYKLVQAAESIVYFGVDKALNSQKDFPLSEDTKSDLNDRIWSPIGLFGTNNKTMIVLERYELESYRSVQLLMEEVINLKNKSILSIAVFGPPGSGKSFVSERIADSACEASQVTPVLKKINLASINDSNQLIEKLDKAFSEYFQQYELVKSEIEDNKRIKTLQLIIFFDEFDCSNNDKILGWLKTFLPMMQDGEFTTSINTQKSNYSTYHNQPILIFAGGTSHTYSNFSRQDSSGDPEDQLRFAQAKGPDFVSRLRGHIDILGPSKTSEHDEGYVVRRAILLRTAFLNHVRRIDDKESLEEYIYNPFLRAMLTVSRYKHGARSMEAIIAMCAQLPGGKISSASMPTHAQLNMHVDANEFLKIVRSNS